MIASDRILCMDAIDGLRKLDDESVDLVITDPPYNIASKNRKTIRHGRLMTTMEAWGAWDRYHPFDYDVLIMTVLIECYRVLKPGGSLYMFTAARDNGYFIRKAVARGFTYRNQLIIVKTTAMPSIYKNSWRNAFDVCMYLTKGRVGVFNFPSQAECVNVYPYPIRRKRTGHPTQKPLEFVRKLVAISSNPGDLVLDPFLGSGTTAVAAAQLGRRYIGFEQDRGYVKMARERLRREGAHEPVKSGIENDNGKEDPGTG